MKKRYELIFTTPSEPTEQELTAIENVVKLALNLVAIANNESNRFLLNLKVQLKEK